LAHWESTHAPYHANAILKQRHPAAWRLRDSSPAEAYINLANLVYLVRRLTQQPLRLLWGLQMNRCDFGPGQYQKDIHLERGVTWGWQWGAANYEHGAQVRTHTQTRASQRANTIHVCDRQEQRRCLLERGPDGNFDCRWIARSYKKGISRGTMAALIYSS
jgi:hypothetical protein